MKGALAPSHRYEVWRTTSRGGWTRHSVHRFRWVARLVAWEHTTRGWFTYEVRDVDAI